MWFIVLSYPYLLACACDVLLSQSQSQCTWWCQASWIGSCRVSSAPAPAYSRKGKTRCPTAQIFQITDTLSARCAVPCNPTSDRRPSSTRTQRSAFAYRPAKHSASASACKTQYRPAILSGSVRPSITAGVWSTASRYTRCGWVVAVLGMFLVAADGYAQMHPRMRPTGRGWLRVRSVQVACVWQCLRPSTSVPMAMQYHAT